MNAANTVLMERIVDLARGASIEINAPDVRYLAASREFLAPGTKIYVSHLPNQQWDDTIGTCSAVRAVGFNAVPHIPVRLIESENAFDALLNQLMNACVREILLIAGDYPQPKGPYSSVGAALRQHRLREFGIEQISFAGHPEGHPQVSKDIIREAEAEKAAMAVESGLHSTFLTQFFFEAEPFLDWSREMRDRGVRANLVAGLAGPANPATLFKFAVRCGVGPSMRALGARPLAALKLMSDHGPENILSDLAKVQSNGRAGFNGIHLFCFGGFLRTCRWLQSIARGHFALTANGFKVV